MLAMTNMSMYGCRCAFAKAIAQQWDNVLLAISNCRCRNSGAHSAYGASGQLARRRGPAVSFLKHVGAQGLPRSCLEILSRSSLTLMTKTTAWRPRSDAGKLFVLSVGADETPQSVTAGFHVCNMVGTMYHTPGLT